MASFTEELVDRVVDNNISLVRAYQELCQYAAEHIAELYQYIGADGEGYGDDQKVIILDKCIEVMKDLDNWTPLVKELE